MRVISGPAGFNPHTDLSVPSVITNITLTYIQTVTEVEVKESSLTYLCSVEPSVGFVPQRFCSVLLCLDRLQVQHQTPTHVAGHEHLDGSGSDQLFKTAHFFSSRLLGD